MRFSTTLWLLPVFLCSHFVDGFPSLPLSSIVNPLGCIQKKIQPQRRRERIQFLFWYTNDRSEEFSYGACTCRVFLNVGKNREAKSVHRILLQIGAVFWYAFWLHSCTCHKAKKKWHCKAAKIAVKQCAAFATLFLATWWKMVYGQSKLSVWTQPYPGSPDQVWF